MKKLMMCIAIFINLTTEAQDSISKRLTFSSYAEAYYSYDFNQPPDNMRPVFFYSHNRHNEFNVNLAYIKASYNAERVRANLAFAAGTYINANYAAEPGVLKNIYEANVGYKLSANKNFWFDIGILPSHIGFETAASKECWTLTRSMVADNSPYFESGAKLTYVSDNGKITVSALALNGWQRITRVEGNSLMSWGTQLYLRPGEKITFNYSTFFGTDKPDSARLFRSYHNFYSIFQLNDKIGFTAGFDMGFEDKAVNNSENNKWFTPVGIIRISPNAKWAFALRGEYFNDDKGVIIFSGSQNGFKTIGWSVNIDFVPVENATLRLEFRNLKSKDKIFLDKDGATSNRNSALTFSSAISF